MKNVKMIFCKCCNEQTKYTLDNFARYHLTSKHKMTTQQYYDKYLKKDDKDGICVVCGNNCSFWNMNKGYSRCCSYKCMREDVDYHDKRNSGIKTIDFNGAAKTRRETVRDKYGVDYISQDASFRNRVKNTCLEKYGVENTLSLKQVKDQRNLSLSSNDVIEKRIKGIKESANTAKVVRRETLLTRYGVESPSKITGFREKVRETLRRKYGFCSYDDVDNFIAYRKEVVYLTSKIRKQMYKINDTCYYSGIRMTPSGFGNLSKTIDHKISIVYGFKNNIPPEKLSAPDNLCVACRIVNIIKNYRTEEEFRNSPLFERALNAVK